MNTILGFILILVLGYVGSQITLFQNRLSSGSRTLFLSGTEFLFIGLLLGPFAFNILSKHSLHQLMPILSLALGWIGLLIGLQFDHRIVVRIPRHAWKIAGFISLFTFLLIFLSQFVGMAILVFSFQDLVLYIQQITILDSAKRSLIPSLLAWSFVIGWIGTVSSYSSLAEFKRSTDARGETINLLQILTDLRMPYAILVLGFSYALFHVTSFNPSFAFEPIQSLWPADINIFGIENTLASQPVQQPVMAGFLWLLVTLLLGVSMGFMLHYLTCERLADNKMLLLTSGAVIFSSGLSTSLHLSPLLVNLIMGITLANVPNFAHTRITSMLLSTEKPFFVVFMILMGAMWPPLTPLSIGITLLFFLSRALGLYLAAKAALDWTPSTENKVPDSLGLAMLPQGGAAIAIAADYALIHPGSLAELLLSIVITAVIVNQLVGPPLTFHILQSVPTIKANASSAPPSVPSLGEEK
jgi:hypothetical protein